MHIRLDHTDCQSYVQQQLGALMDTLNTTEPHYIRCVKPNMLNKPGRFENQNVIQQLRCGVSLVIFCWVPLSDFGLVLVHFHWFSHNECGLILCRESWKQSESAVQVTQHGARFMSFLTGLGCLPRRFLRASKYLDYCKCYIDASWWVLNTNLIIRVYFALGLEYSQASTF